MLEISRWLVAVGGVAAAVGLTLVGMATSTFTTMADLFQGSFYLMIGGLVVFIIGLLLNHRLDQPDASSDL